MKTEHRSRIDEAYNDYRSFSRNMAALEMPYRWELEIMIEHEYRKLI